MVQAVARSYSFLPKSREVGLAPPLSLGGGASWGSVLPKMTCEMSGKSLAAVGGLFSIRGLIGDAAIYFSTSPMKKSDVTVLPRSTVGRSGGLRKLIMPQNITLVGCFTVSVTGTFELLLAQTRSFLRFGGQYNSNGDSSKKSTRLQSWMDQSTAVHRRLADGMLFRCQFSRQLPC